jgi:hypothetical protein
MASRAEGGGELGFEGLSDFRENFFKLFVCQGIFRILERKPVGEALFTIAEIENAYHFE